jgi:hypothetical protein
MGTLASPTTLARPELMQRAVFASEDDRRRVDATTSKLKFGTGSRHRTARIGGE